MGIYTSMAIVHYNYESSFANLLVSKLNELNFIFLRDWKIRKYNELRLAVEKCLMKDFYHVR